MGLQIILTAFIVSWGLTSGRTNDRMDMKVTSRIEDEIEIKANFRNLFDSLTKNDFGRREAYRNLLEGEAAKEKEAFDSMKEKFRFARHSNVYKRNNFHAASFKRETHGNDSETGLETTAEAETTEPQSSTSPSTPKWTTRLRFTGISRFTPEFEATTVVQKVHPKIYRQQVLDIFPGPNNTDPYTETLFYNFTGMSAVRVSRRSRRNIHAAIAKPDFRAFIREMNIFARRVPFKQMLPKHEDNRDGLYFRAAFYLLLRAFNYPPTPYFNTLMQEHKVISVETEKTVFLFAVNVGVNVDDDYSIAMFLVQGPTGKMFPRDNKTILCAGIHFDTEFDPKIRHFRAAIRDKTLLPEKKNDTSSSTSSDEED